MTTVLHLWLPILVSAALVLVVFRFVAVAAFVGYALAL
jgi:hypothetical protein